MGITAISMGFGAIFPQINIIAKPFVCSDGHMESTGTLYNPYPGKNVLQRNWYCRRDSGSVTELSNLSISFFAGIVHGIVLYLVLIFLGFIRRSGRKS